MRKGLACEIFACDGPLTSDGRSVAETLTHCAPVCSTLREYGVRGSRDAVHQPPAATPFLSDDMWPRWFHGGRMSDVAFLRSQMKWYGHLSHSRRTIADCSTAARVSNISELAAARRFKS